MYREKTLRGLNSQSLSSFPMNLDRIPASLVLEFCFSTLE